MRLIFLLPLLWVLSPSAAVGLDRTAADYIDACFLSDSEAAFTEWLKEEPGWEEITLDFDQPPLDFDSIETLTPELIVMLGSFSSGYLRSRTRKRDISQRLNDFNNAMSEARFSPIYRSTDHKTYYNAQGQQLLGIKGFEPYPPPGCFYTAFQPTMDTSILQLGWNFPNSYGLRLRCRAGREVHDFSKTDFR